jgi:hypothetical protein
VVLLRGPAATASVFTWTKLDVWHSKGSLTPTAVPSGNLIYGDEGAVVIEAADGTATLHALDGSVELLLPHARDPLLSVICNEKVRSVESDGRTITSRLEVGLKVTEEFQFPSAVTPVALLNNQYLLTWDENAPDEYQVRSARPAMDGVEVVGLKLEHTFPHHLPVERIRSTACSQDGRINFVDGTVRRTYLFQDLGIPASRYTVISSPADAEFLGMVDLDWNAETAVAVRRGDDFYLYGDVGAP